jgi:hypothetical protein
MKLPPDDQEYILDQSPWSGSQLRGWTRDRLKELSFWERGGHLDVLVMLLVILTSRSSSIYADCEAHSEDRKFHLADHQSRVPEQFQNIIFLPLLVVTQRVMEALQKDEPEVARMSITHSVLREEYPGKAVAFVLLTGGLTNWHLGIAMGIVPPIGTVIRARPDLNAGGIYVYDSCTGNAVKGSLPYTPATAIKSGEPVLYSMTSFPNAGAFVSLENIGKSVQSVGGSDRICLPSLLHRLVDFAGTTSR